MSHKALGAEFVGTFMLMASICGSAFYSFGAPSGPAGILVSPSRSVSPS